MGFEGGLKIQGRETKFSRPVKIPLPLDREQKLRFNEKGDKYTAYFAIPKQFLRGSKKWRRVIVVFGDREYAVAKVYPKDDLNKFEFEEKSRL